MTGGSLWDATAPPVTPHPPLSTDLEVDVAVVGGGIVGLVAAILAAERGLEVVLLERSRLGAGTTGRTTGKVQAEHGGRYRSLVDHLGREGAATYAAANLRGRELLDRLVDDGALDAGYVASDAHLVAVEASDAGSIDEEAAAMREAGLAPEVLTSAPELPFAVANVLRLADQREFHPVALVRELGRFAVERGAVVHEGTPVESLRRRRGRRPGWTLSTPEARVRAVHVVLATRLPVLDRRLLFGRSEVTAADAVSVRAVGPPLEGSYYLLGERSRSLRSSRWPAGEEDHLLAIAPAAPTGDRTSADELERWLAERFELGEDRHVWRAWDQQPFDDRPFVGPAGGGGLWTATGFGKWGLALGADAAAGLVDRITGRRRADARFFSSDRVTGLGTGGLRLAKGNAQIAAHFVGDRLGLGDLDVGSLAPGEGVVARHRGRPVAACRTDDGQLHAVSAVCTHLGCLVDWDAVQQDWGCPCHGSRFAPDGTVLEAPATRPLTPVDLDRD